MLYPSSYNKLINDWFNDPANLKQNDPFLSVPGTGLLTPNYFAAMPEPILGDLDNNIAVLLNLNPGYTDINNKKGYQPDNVVLGKAKMRSLVNSDYEAYAKPFPHLCASPHHRAAADWWTKRQKWLEKIAAMHNGFTATYTNGIPDLKPVALELCPYHSKEWPEAKIIKFNQSQRKWIEENPFAAASHAVKHSKLPFIISIGKPVFDNAIKLGFDEIMRWSSSKDCIHWPKNKKGRDKKKTFVVLQKKMNDGCILKMLNIWSMFQQTPSTDFDPVLEQLLTYL